MPHLLGPLLAIGIATTGFFGPTAAPLPGVRAFAGFPSRPTYGVAAHYVVYRVDAPGLRPTLAVLQAQTPPAYLDALHAMPVPGAVVTYPDGSVQRTDAEGAFDTAASGYAARHPQQPLQPDVPVRIRASSGNATLVTSAALFAPAPGVEANTASGTIADGTLDPTGAQPNFAFSCNPANFSNGRIDITAGALWTSAKFIAKASISYYPLFGFCGVENSFFEAPPYVTAVRHWEESTTKITVEKGQVPGCNPPTKKKPLARDATTTFECLVRNWNVDATFSPNIAWSQQTDVALWFEAWDLNVFRDHTADKHFALLHVR